MEDKLKSFRKLTEVVIYSQCKASAKSDIEKMNFMATELCGKTNGYVRTKIRDVVIFAGNAAGQPKDKMRQIDRFEVAWLAMESALDDNN